MKERRNRMKEAYMRLKRQEALDNGCPPVIYVGDGMDVPAGTYILDDGGKYVLLDE